MAATLTIVHYSLADKLHPAGQYNIYKKGNSDLLILSYNADHRGWTPRFFANQDYDNAERS